MCIFQSMWRRTCVVENMFHSGGNWSTESLNNFPQVTGLRVVELGFQLRTGLGMVVVVKDGILPIEIVPTEGLGCGSGAECFLSMYRPWVWSPAPCTYTQSKIMGQKSRCRKHSRVGCSWVPCAALDDPIILYNQAPCGWHCFPEPERMIKMWQVKWGQGT